MHALPNLPLLLTSMTRNHLTVIARGAFFPRHHPRIIRMPHCYFEDNSVKCAVQIQEQGSKYTLDVEDEDDLERQVIRTSI